MAFARLQHFLYQHRGCAIFVLSTDPARLLLTIDT